MKFKIFAIIFSIFFIIIPVKADLTKKQQDNLVSFVTGFIETGMSKKDSNGFPLLAYSTQGRINGYFNKLYYMKKDFTNSIIVGNNKWGFDCSSFASFVYKQLFNLYLTRSKTSAKDPYSGLKLLSQKVGSNPWMVSNFVDDANIKYRFNYVFKNSKGSRMRVTATTIDYSKMVPGDLIIIPGEHIMIYLGDKIFAHSSRSEINEKTKNLGFGYNILELKYPEKEFYVIRIKDHVIDPAIEGNTKITWIDDGTVTDFGSNYTSINTVLERKDWSNEEKIIVRAVNNNGITGYSIDSSNITDISKTNTFNYEYVVKSNGVYNIAIRDSKGNITKKSVLVTNIDSTPPTVVSVKKSKITAKGCYYTVTATDNESGIGILAYSYDNGVTWTNNTKVYVKSGDNYRVIVYDKAGNKTLYKEGSIELDLSIDTTNWASEKYLIITAKGDNLISGYSVNSSSYTNVSLTNNLGIKYKVTNNGTYVVRIKDIDNNIVEKTITVTKIDNILPTISKVTKSSISSKGCYYTITASDSNSKLPSKPYSYDNGMTWTSTKKVYVKTGNVYSIWVRDNANNIKKYTNDYTVLNVTSSTTKWTRELNLIINATNRDGISEYAVNNSTYKNTSLPFNTNYKITSNGTYTVAVSDQYGNITKKSITIKNIDNIPPVISKISKTSKTTKGCYYTITATDSNSKLPSKPYSYDNGMTWTSTRKVYVKTNEKYSVMVRDNANNISYYSI